MKCTVELTEVERCTLRELSSNHRHPDFRIRARALLLLAQGRRVRDIARELDVTYKSVYNWAHGWRMSGICGLLVGHSGGRPPLLSRAMLATAIEAARAESTTLTDIAERIEVVHGAPLPCQLETLARALKARGVAYQRGKSCKAVELG